MLLTFNEVAERLGLTPRALLARMIRANIAPADRRNWRLSAPGGDVSDFARRLGLTVAEAGK